MTIQSLLTVLHSVGLHVNIGKTILIPTDYRLSWSNSRFNQSQSIPTSWQIPGYERPHCSASAEHTNNSWNPSMTHGLMYLCDFLCETLFLLSTGFTMDNLCVKEAQYRQIDLAPPQSSDFTLPVRKQGNWVHGISFFPPPSTEKNITDVALLGWGTHPDKHTQLGTWTHQEPSCT